MYIRKIFFSMLLALTSMTAFNTAADNINANAARAMANSFIKSHFKASLGMLKAPALADIVLAYAEPLESVTNANAYYIFNIKGGGFIIVSGDDFAAPVLGYSEKGEIDVNHMPGPLTALLDGYKKEIEYLKTHKSNRTQSLRSNLMESECIVEPMLTSTWGPEEPYNYQCPTVDGVHSRVGCVAVSMAQMIYFWQFPQTFISLPSYYSSYLGENVPALPSVSVDYSLMIDSYCHWDFDHKKVILDTFTDAQAQEVAKVCRYCGQSVKMNYNPSISTTTKSRLTAMKNFGYSSKGVSYYRTDFDDDVWMDMIRTELNEERPVMYLAYGSNSVGHSFILDGYDSEDFLHINMGWYGHADGWYLLTAIIFTGRFGEYRDYCNKHSMIVGLEPPLFCSINTDITANTDLLMLGEELNPQALNTKLSMSYRTLPFMFTLTDANGFQVAVSESVNLRRLTFENGSDICLGLTIPENLPQGTYNLNLNYRTADNKPLTQAVTAEGKLYVLGKFAKFGAPFGIDDVISAIDMVLSENGQADITDVTMLIDYLLAN